MSAQLMTMWPRLPILNGKSLGVLYCALSFSTLARSSAMVFPLPCSLWGIWGVNLAPERREVSYSLGGLGGFSKDASSFLRRETRSVDAAWRGRFRTH